MSVPAATSAPYAIDVDHGVVVVTLHLEAITNEALLEEIKQHVVSRLDEASTAVLFDCHRLIGRVTSQFLATLVAVRRHASRQGLLVCVCSLKGPVREAYDISCLARIIPAYRNREMALSALGEYDQAERVERTRKRLKQSKNEPDEEEGNAKTSAPVGLRERLADLPIMEGNARVALIAGLGLLLGGVAGYAIWQVFSNPIAPPPTRRAGPAEEIATINSNGILLQGSVAGAQGPEAGAWVIAWPAGNDAIEPIDAAIVKRYFNGGAIGGLRQPHLHAGRALGDGTFSLRLGEAGDYYVLAISQQQQGDGNFRGDDMRKLKTRFTNPSVLIGKQQYQAEFHELDDGSELSLKVDG